LVFYITCISAADVFTVDELAVYEGTPDEHTYAVSGDILDGVNALVLTSPSIA
jgi:hypothetical protein